MSIKNLAAADAALAAYIPLAATYTKDNLSVERLHPLLAALHDPHERLRVVHVAGTSGKTSTAYFMATLLRKANKRVGLTVSPHIHAVNERVQINGGPLDEALFCSYLERFLPVVETMAFKPSYFELLIAFALWVFSEEKVDYAVVETGLGGLLDSTNVVTNQSKICILTDIGYDHQHILGNTLEEIAAQKAGIMHRGNVAFTYKQSNQVMQVFEERAEAVGATLQPVNTTASFLAPIEAYSRLPRFQRRNWLLAYQAFKYIQNRDVLPELTSEDLESTMRTVVPGRMQLLRINNKNVLLDGAHNQQKMHAFVESFKELHGNKKVPVLLALKKDKAYKQVLNELLPIAGKLIVTGFTASQDRPVESVQPELLAQYCKDNGFINIAVIQPIEDAYTALLQEDSELLVVTGSLYIVNERAIVN